MNGKIACVSILRLRQMQAFLNQFTEKYFKILNLLVLQTSIIHCTIFDDLSVIYFRNYYTLFIGYFANETRLRYGS